ncbi:MAG: hypothetical protein WAM70_05235 [Pyrinomonadaceae bacterium]
MRRLMLIFMLLIAACPVAYGQANQPCADFNQLVKSTYNFRPALLSEAEKDQKSAAMDKVWETVKSRRSELLPCLRKALEDPNADQWFRFDGSNLLVSLDPSEASKQTQVKSYAVVNLEDVNLQVWVGTLARLGAEGFDVSKSGERWLAHPTATYYLPIHGAQKVDKMLGGIFIFGSMDEAYATPALLKIANAATHPGRDDAISLLIMQATPEAISGLKKVDTSTLSAQASANLQRHLTTPVLIQLRDKPKTTREQFLKAFNDAAGGNFRYFFQLVGEVPDGEKDVVATLKAEDIPLVRKVRRVIISRANQHAAGYYVSFTQILMTMIWRPEMAK